MDHSYLLPTSGARAQTPLIPFAVDLSCDLLCNKSDKTDSPAFTDEEMDRQWRNEGQDRLQK